MKKLFKKIMVVIMAIIISLTAVPLSSCVGWNIMSCAADTDEVEYTYGIYTYTVENNSATITDCDSSATGEIIIPSVINGYAVTHISYGAFSNCNEITKITVPDTVKTISHSAFYNCTKLKDIVLPDSLTYIEHNAFNYTEFYNTADNWESGVLYCGKYLITANSEAPNVCYIKDGTELIAASAFSNWEGNCGHIEEIIIPDSVKRICSDAFGYTNLKSITIGKNVEYIGTCAFWCCDGLESVYYNGNAADWCNIEFDHYVVQGYISELSSGNPLCYANNLYINNALVTDLIIPEGVTEIKELAFHGCTSIKTVSLPSTLTDIKTGAFSNCSGIESFTVHSNNPVYSSDASGVLYNKDKTVLLQYPPTASATKYDIPNTVKTIGDSSFEACQNLTSITIPDSVKAIEDSAFSFCTKLDNVTIPDSVNNIGVSVFYKCENLSSIKLPDNLTNISDGLFSYCAALKSIDLPQTVTSIGESAFYCCSGLESIDIPDEVTEIGDSAFRGCTALKSVGFSSKLKIIGQQAFENTAIQSVALPEGLSELGYSAFAGCSALESISIPGSLKSLESGTFRGCSALKSVVFSENSQLESIGYGVFRTCINLNEINIPDSVKFIDEYAFNGCLNLKSISGGNNIEEIIATAFEDTSYYLSEDNWDNGVLYVGSALLAAKSSVVSGEYSIKPGTKAIADSAFNNCYKLTSVSVPDSVINFGERTFEFCGNLQTINLPQNLTKINNGTFYCCTNLKNISIPESVEYIGSESFSHSGIESVNIPANVAEIAGDAFDNCTQLEGFNVSIDNTNYSSENGVLYNNGKTELLIYPRAKQDAEFNVPDSVVTIKSNAFYNCLSLESVICGEGLTDIEGYAFTSCCNLKTVIFSESLQKIGHGAFYDCSLENIYIPAGVIEIGSRAFSYNKIKEITVAGNNTNYLSENGILYNKDKTTLMQFPVSNENIVDFSIPYGVINVDFGAFSGSEYLENLIISNSVTTVRDINNCLKLSTITIGKNLKILGDFRYSGIYGSVLYGCNNLTCIKVDKENLYYSSDAFGVLFNKDKSNLLKYPGASTNTYYAVPDGTIYVESHSFDFAVNLTELSLPTSIRGFYAFGYSIDWHPSQIDIYYDGSQAQWAKVYRWSTTGINVHFAVDGTTTEEEPVKAETVVNENADVSVEYNTNFNSGNVSLDVKQTFDGSAFDIINSETEITQNIIYDIKMMVDGIETQPKGTVTVKIPLPSGYDPNRTYVYYINTQTGMVENMKADYVNGYLVFQTNHFSYYAVVETENTYTEQFYCEFVLKQPSTTTINYGETLILYADLGETQLPESYSILWTVEGSGVTIQPSEDGLTCNVTSVQSGNVTVKATVVDENGEAICDTDGNEITAAQQLKSNVNFWQKIVSFFKNLFGISRIILQYK